MERSEKEKDKAQVRNFKIIISFVFGIAAIYVFLNTAQQAQGAELWGALTGFIIIMGLCSTLLYSTQRGKIKQEKKERQVFKEEQKTKNDYFQKKEKLTSLKSQGILSESEFNEKMRLLKVSKVNQEIVKTKQYEELQYLYKSGVLSKEEFESKIKILKSKLNTKENSSNEKTSEKEF